MTNDKEENIKFGTSRQEYKEYDPKAIEKTINEYKDFRDITEDEQKEKFSQRVCETCVKNSPVFDQILGSSDNKYSISDFDNFLETVDYVFSLFRKYSNSIIEKFNNSEIVEKETEQLITERDLLEDYWKEWREDQIEQNKKVKPAYSKRRTKIVRMPAVGRTVRSIVARVHTMIILLGRYIGLSRMNYIEYTKLGMKLNIAIWFYSLVDKNVQKAVCTQDHTLVRHFSAGRKLTIRELKFYNNLANFTENDVRDDLSLNYYANQLASSKFGAKADSRVVTSIINKGKSKYGENYSQLKDYVKSIYTKPNRE